MADYTVDVLRIGQAPEAGKDGRFHNVTRVTIMVGSHGPFTQDFQPGEDTPEIINAWKQQKANAIRAIAGN